MTGPPGPAWSRSRCMARRSRTFTAPSLMPSTTAASVSRDPFQAPQDQNFAVAVRQPFQSGSDAGLPLGPTQPGTGAIGRVVQKTLGQGGGGCVGQQGWLFAQTLRWPARRWRR